MDLKSLSNEELKEFALRGGDSAMRSARPVHWELIDALVDRIPEGDPQLTGDVGGLLDGFEKYMSEDFTPLQLMCLRKHFKVFRTAVTSLQADLDTARGLLAALAPHLGGCYRPNAREYLGKSCMFCGYAYDFNDNECQNPSCPAVRARKYIKDGEK